MPTPRSGLGHRFHLFWFGEAVSVLGTTTSSVLLPLVAVVSLHAGPAWMGLLTAAAWLPWLVVGLPAGAMVDRLEPRMVMIRADLVAAASIASIPLAAAAHRLTLPHLVLAAMANGTCSVFFRSAYARLVKSLVAEPDRPRAMGRLAATESGSQVAGPGVAGVLATLGAATGLLVDAFSFLVSAACLSRMPRSPAPAQASDAPLRARIAEGIRVTRTDAYVRFFAWSGSVSNVGLTGYAALLVLFLVRDLGLDPRSVGLVLSVSSLGGVTAATLAPMAARRFGSARTLTALQLVAGPGALLIPIGGLLARGALGTVPVVAGLALVGFGVVGGNVLRSAFFQSWVPDQVLSRVITANGVLLYGGMPVAGLLAGVLGTTLGLRPTIAVMAGVHCLACFAVLRAPFRGRRDLPSGPMPEVARPVRVSRPASGTSTPGPSAQRQVEQRVHGNGQEYHGDVGDRQMEQPHRTGR